MKSVSVEGAHLTAALTGITYGSRTGLLHGGATHCLRYGPPCEFQMSRPVEVHLASGSTQELRINAASCTVCHPWLGSLDVTMVKNCPEVEVSLCLELIREVEEKRAEAMIRSVNQAESAGGINSGWADMSDEGFLDSFKVWVRKVCCEVPERVLAEIAPKQCHEPWESGLNRHTRRRLQRGSSFVHLFVGEQRWDFPGSPSIALDLKRGHDLRDDKLYWYLLQLARQGMIQYLLGGPPCRTFTPLRGRATGPSGDGGPRIVRTREGATRFGLYDLSPEEATQVDGDNLLFFRFILLADVSAEGLRARQVRDNDLKMPKLFFGCEHPEDPQEFLPLPEEGQWPSVGVWPEVRSFVRRHQLFEACFHQGLLGHCKVKPTRMMVSSSHLWERLHMLKVPKGGLWKPKESMLLDQRIRDSAKWATWAPQLVAFIQQSMHEWQKGLDHVVRADSERQVRLQQLMLAEGAGIELGKGFCTRALKGPEAERFRQHCLAGHRPWRSDCKACLDAMSYSRPHRRMQKSRACALSIDVSGPF